jgi:methyl-accepting chemotaxis protein
MFRSAPKAVPATLLTGAGDRPDDTEIIAFIEAMIAGRCMTRLNSNHPLAGSLNKLVEVMCQTKRDDIDRAVTVSIQTSKTAIETAHIVSDLREISDEVEAMAAASEEMVASVREIKDTGADIAEKARVSQEATKTSALAVEEASAVMDDIAAVVSDTVDGIDRLNAFTREIAAMADTIKTIASQTNMLSLNAAIEAARAGDVGRGFAVVAGEVRALSAKTTETTRGIDALVDSLQSEMSSITTAMERSRTVVASGGVAVTKASTEMANVKHHTEEMSVNVRQISEVLSQQAEASQRVADGILDIANRTSSNVAAIEQAVDYVGAIETSMDDWVVALADAQVPGKIIKLAKSDHVTWKKKLMRMVVGREHLDGDKLSDHRNCRLGKWHQSCTDEIYRNHPAFGAISAPHELLHTRGKEAVRLYNAGNLEGALAAIEQVEIASEEVLRHLNVLDDLAKSG